MAQTSANDPELAKASAARVLLPSFRIQAVGLAPPAGFEPATIGSEGSLTPLRVHGATVNLHESEELAETRTSPVVSIPTRRPSD